MKLEEFRAQREKGPMKVPEREAKPEVFVVGGFVVDPLADVSEHSLGVVEEGVLVIEREHVTMGDFGGDSDSPLGYLYTPGKGHLK